MLIVATRDRSTPTARRRRGAARRCAGSSPSATRAHGRSSTSCSGAGSRFPSDLVVARAEGYPFFVEELLATFVERGLLVRVGDHGWDFAGAGDVEGRPGQHPHAPRGTRRPPRAGAEGRSAGRSVIGRRFDPDVVRRTIGALEADFPACWSAISSGVAVAARSRRSSPAPSSSSTPSPATSPTRACPRTRRPPARRRRPRPRSDRHRRPTWHRCSRTTSRRPRCCRGRGARVGRSRRGARVASPVGRRLADPGRSPVHRAAPRSTRASRSWSRLSVRASRRRAGRRVACHRSWIRAALRRPTLLGRDAARGRAV